MDIVTDVLPKNAIALKLTFHPDDYLSDFQKQIKQYAKQAVISGFRQGKVPQDLIKAKYGQSILYDLINKKVSEEIQKHVESENLHLIARPLLKDSDLKNLKSNESFDFEFHMALFPEFEIDYSKINPLTDFDIEITEKDIEDQIKYIQRNEGTLTLVPVMESDELYKIQGELYEIDDTKNRKVDGFSTVLLVYSDAEKMSPHLRNGVKEGEILYIPFDSYFETDKDASYVLNFPIEKVQELKGKSMAFEVQKIWSVKVLDRETELFQKVLQNPSITYEEGLAEFKKIFENDLKNMNNNYKKREAEKQLLENHDFEINEEIVAYSLMADNNLNSVVELIRKYPNYINNTKVEIIKQKIFKENPSLSVTVKDVAKKVENDFKVIFNYNDSQVETLPENSKEAETTELKPTEMVQDSTLSYIQSVTKQMMQDKSFVNKKMYEMEELNLQSFLESKIGIKSEKTTVKDFFEKINAI